MTPPLLALEHGQRSLEELSDRLHYHAYHAAALGVSYNTLADIKIRELSDTISMLKNEREAHFEEVRVCGDKLKVLMEEKDKENARLSSELDSKSISLGDRERELTESQAEVERLREELTYKLG